MLLPSVCDVEGSDSELGNGGQQVAINYWRNDSTGALGKLCRQCHWCEGSRLQIVMPGNGYLSGLKLDLVDFRVCA